MTKNVFSYRNGVLCTEAMPLAEIAEEIDTPFYCLSTKQLQRNARVLTQSVEGVVPYVHYAARVNPNLAVLRSMASHGVGAEVVSVGELERAIESGILPSKIIMAGKGKCRDDIAAALLADVSVIYASSLSELSLINEVAACLNKTAPVALVVGFDGLPMPSAFSLEQMGEALACLMQSTACSLQGFAGVCLNQATCEHVVKIVHMFRDSGLAVAYLGLFGHTSLPFDGKSYTSFESYVGLLRKHIVPLGCSLSMQFGSRLVSDAGALVARVAHVDRSGSSLSVTLDVALSECAGPAFFQAKNEIIPVREDLYCEHRTTSVLGPHGGRTDSFGNYVLPATVKPGDLVSIMNVGAYGSVMASMYGGRSLIPEIMVSASQYAVIRRRLAVAEQMGWEAYPEWLEKNGRVA